MNAPSKKAGKKPDNKLQLKQGQARFYRKIRAKNRWADENIPEFEPNWLVRFSVCGRTWMVTAEKFPTAEGMDNVKVWAKEMILTQAELLQRGEIEKVRAMREAARVVTLAELARVYLAHVPPGKPDYVKNADRLTLILTEMTGLPEERILMTDEVLTRAGLLGWVRMRQEFFRRGWSARGAAPADAWEVLRGELKAGRLPGVDKTTVMEGNTTIQTYVRCAKAVFANKREYLMGLTLPPLKDFVEFSVSLAVPEGGRSISDEAAARLLEAEPALRQAKPKVWAFGLLMARTGARPITIQGLAGSALTVNGDGTGVVAVPAAKRGKPVLWPLPADLTAVLVGLRTEGSLFGARHKTDARKVYLDFNAWLTENGVTGTHKAYLLRHERGQQLRDHGGLEMASAGLGHRTTAMVERKYTEASQVMPMLGPKRTKKGA